MCTGGIRNTQTLVAPRAIESMQISMIVYMRTRHGRQCGGATGLPTGLRPPSQSSSRTTAHSRSVRLLGAHGGRRPYLGRLVVGAGLNRLCYGLELFRL